MSNQKKYSQIFEYLSSNEEATHETGLVVFGRKDLLVARKALEIISQGATPWSIITGGTGKDSGGLQMPEAVYLANAIKEEANRNRTSLPVIYLDTKATNGGENARNSLTIIEQESLPHEHGVTTIAHATSSRRLAEMVKHAVAQQNKEMEVYRQATDYSFDPTSLLDQKEARGEILRLADWPARNWLLPQADLPDDFVDFARDVESRNQ